MQDLKKLSGILTIRTFMALRYPDKTQDHLAQKLIKHLVEAFIGRVRVFTIMGKAGCGKGTLSSWFIKELNQLLPGNSRYETIVLGEYFRNILRIKKAPESATAQDLERYGSFASQVTDKDLARMKAGKMISDQTVIEVITAILQTEPYNKAFGLFIDGFPRNLAQAKILQSGNILWHGKPLTVDLFVYTHIPRNKDTLFKRRALMRVTHEIAMASLENREPRIRDDDKPEVMEERLATFYSKTQPGISYILKNNKERSFKIQGTTEGDFQDSIVMDRAKFLIGWMLRSGLNIDLEDLEDIKRILHLT